MVREPEETGARADRQFQRSIGLGLLVLAAVAVIGPLISYRSDIDELRAEVQSRVSREARVRAEALALHFEVLVAELDRVAARTEINLLDNENSSEAAFVGVTHRHSALFGAGVSILDAQGRVVAEEPRGALTGAGDLAAAPWFQQVLAFQTTRIDALPGVAATVVVAVPVVRAGKTTGAVVGLVRGHGAALPGAAAERSSSVVVVDPRGRPFAFSADRAALDVDALLAARPASPGSIDERIVLGAVAFVASRVPVGHTGLSLWVLTEEASLLAPVRVRLLAQLGFIALLQTATLALFTLLGRRSYRSFLRMEQDETRQQRMVALGGAASLIAHEVKNSLNGLNAAAALLPPGPETEAAVRTIRGQVDRLRHLATSLLHFGKPARAQLRALRLDEVVRETIAGLRVLPEADEVEVVSATDSPLEVKGDPLLLATAIDNLVRNAIEATVAAKDLGRQPRPRVDVRVGARDARAFVSVEDNAGGPSAELEPRLFEPFVTSKPKGIGLGLAMARRAMEQQGGALAFERLPNGSRFTVELALETR